jgi:hypothetical protein
MQQKPALCGIKEDAVENEGEDTVDIKRQLQCVRW